MTIIKRIFGSSNIEANATAEAKRAFCDRIIALAEKNGSTKAQIIAMAKAERDQ